MAAKVTIRVSRGTDKRVAREMKRLAKAIGDTTRANRQVSVWLVRWVNSNFRSEGGKVGGWVGFKNGGRRIKGGGIDTTAKLLQDTGKMRASFLPFHSRRQAGIGSDLDRSVWHDAGLPNRSLPARRLLPNNTDTDVNRAVLKIYDVHLKRAVR